MELESIVLKEIFRMTKSGRAVLRAVGRVGIKQVQDLLWK